MKRSNRVWERSGRVLEGPEGLGVVLGGSWRVLESLGGVPGGSWRVREGFREGPGGSGRGSRRGSGKGYGRGSGSPEWSVPYPCQNLNFVERS